MAVTPGHPPTKRKKKKTDGIEKGPSRSKATPSPKKDTFAGARELGKHDEARRKIFRGK